MNAMNFQSKIEVILIQPEYGEEVKNRIFQPGLEIPFGLLCLAAYLEREGISNEVFDWRIYDRPKESLYKMLKGLRPLIVGLTAVTSGIENAARVAKIVKGFDRRITTVIGGCHASALPEETLLYYQDFDYLIHGEGEVALANLTRSIQKNGSPKELKGIAYREGGRVRINPREELISNLDELPFPARHKIDINRYVPNLATRNYMRLPSTGISTARGCPYGCLFCYKGVWGKSVRFRSVNSVISEIEECIIKYGIHDFRFYDDALTFPGWDLKGFCHKIIERGIDISWNLWSRVNDVDYDTLKLMKKAGCYHIKYGIEFGTEKALRLSKKGASLEQAREAVRLTKKAGIECKGSFIFGIPGETANDCKETLRFALEISPDFATFYAYDCIPGSPFYEMAKKGEAMKELPQRVAKQWSVKAYKAFYLRPAFILQRIKALLRTPQREFRSILDGVKMMFRFFLRGG